MTPFTYGFTTAVHDVCLRDRDQEQVYDPIDYDEARSEAPVERQDPIGIVATWLTSLLRPAPASQVRRRHA